MSLSATGAIGPVINADDSCLKQSLSGTSFIHIGVSSKQTALKTQAGNKSSMAVFQVLKTTSLPKVHFGNAPHIWMPLCDLCVHGSVTHTRQRKRNSPQLLPMNVPPAIFITYSWFFNMTLDPDVTGHHQALLQDWITYYSPKLKHKCIHSSEFANSSTHIFQAAAHSCMNCPTANCYTFHSQIMLFLWMTVTQCHPARPG